MRELWSSAGRCRAVGLGGPGWAGEKKRKTEQAAVEQQRVSLKRSIMAVNSNGAEATGGVYVYTGSLHEHRVPEGVTKVVCREDVEAIRSAAFEE
ncbi:hypothetical protein THAOC_35555, partial [Thalassiosira oceanica]